MKKHPIIGLLFYYFIINGFASAVKHGSKAILIVTVIEIFLGLIWFFPIFTSEDK